MNLTTLSSRWRCASRQSSLRRVHSLIVAALPVAVAAQVVSLPYRGSLSQELSAGVQVAVPADSEQLIWDSSSSGFAADGAFSLDLESVSASAPATLHLKAVNAYGRGVQAEWPLTSEASTFRAAVADDGVYLFCNGQYQSTLPVQQLVVPTFPDISADTDRASSSTASGTGIYDARNLVPNPGFESEGLVLVDDGATYKYWPDGWHVWQANDSAEQAMGVRCNRADPLYANGREGQSALMFRQDGAGGFSASSGSAVYAPLVAPLKAGRRYRLTFQALSHVNDLGKTFSVGVGSAPGQWNLLLAQWTAPAAKQTLAEYSYEFAVSPSMAGAAYVGFVCSGSSGIVHLDRVTLVELEGGYNQIDIRVTTEAAAEVAGGRIAFDRIAFSSVAEATNLLYDGGEYRLYHTDYGRLLGQKDNATVPGLSAEGTNDSLTYVFVAEAAGEGRYRLRQKSSGRYLCSSGNYSMTLNEAPSEAARATWTIGEGRDGWLRNTHNGLYLGCDPGKDGDTYISVFSDKSQGAYSTWQLTEAAFPLAEARAALYTRPLAVLLEEADRTLADAAYAESLKDALRTQTAIARGIYANPTVYEDSLTAACTALQTALDNIRAANNEALSTGSDFPAGERFTLALGGTRLASAAQVGALLVRNSLGRTTRFTFEGSALLADGMTVCDDIPTLIYTSADLRFAFSADCVEVYVNGALESVVPLTPSPGNLAKGEERGWWIVGKGAFATLMPEIVSPTQAVAPGAETPNAHGRAERHVLYVRGSQVRLESAVDFHIEREEAPLSSATIHVADEDAWVIFDNTLPSEVIASYLGSIRINGQVATSGVNCRVAVYLNGAAVIPHQPTYAAFTGYSEQLYGGTADSYSTGKHNLGERANAFRSFVLRRGYMACVSTDANGKGYSRVFVADHEDLRLPELPEALDGRISCVQVKRWNYVSKKGWCSTNGNNSVAQECRKMRATWFYTWSADRNSTADCEYVPIKQHLYWPSWSQINGLESSTHVLSINEPDHSEQHESADCSCGGTISAWRACTLTPDFQESGMRIGSPAPTDMQWLYDYIGHVNDMAYRCDFVAIHAYWGTNEMPNARAWYNQLKTIYDKTKRPIWITEWNNGASWTTESWPSGYGEKLEKNRAAIKAILEVLDTCSFVERYSIYNWDSYYRAVINTDDGWVTPAGEVYRDNRPTFAYNAAVQYVPHWWKPSVKDVSLAATADKVAQTVTLTFTNPNLDLTDSLLVQYKPEGSSEWQTLYREPGRNRYDTEVFGLTLPFAEAGHGQTAYRMLVATQGEERWSNEVTCDLSEEKPDGIAAIQSAGVRVEAGRIVLPEGCRYACRIVSADGATLLRLSQAEGAIDTGFLPAGVYILHVEGVGAVRFLKD